METSSCESCPSQPCLRASNQRFNGSVGSAARGFTGGGRGGRVARARAKKRCLSWLSHRERETTLTAETSAGGEQKLSPVTPVSLGRKREEVPIARRTNYLPSLLTEECQDVRLASASFVSPRSGEETKNPSKTPRILSPYWIQNHWRTNQITTYWIPGPQLPVTSYLIGSPPSDAAIISHCI